jgi:pimeloyl-ACP methyl ester carboxylesterase
MAGAVSSMPGQRHEVAGADGTRIGLLTAGSGPGLLLVHGGMGRIERWAPLWARLTAVRRVTAMDRRGRASSGDSAGYSLAKEYEDVIAVAKSVAREDGPLDVFGHSYGATCALGAAARGAPFRRVVLYEPPGPQTVSAEWVERVTELVAEGKPGRAMMSFLTEVLGLSAPQVEALRAAPGAGDVLRVVSATMPREASALMQVDLLDAARVAAPTLLLLGSTSPPWAGEITRILAATMPRAEVRLLGGHGHEGLDTAPSLVADQVEAFLDLPTGT